VPETRTTRTRPNGDGRAVFAWCLYDFANSAFTTLIVTFVYATYFTEKVAPDSTTGTALWSRGVTVTALAVALLSPLLGAIADRGGWRKRLLFVSTLLTICFSVRLYAVHPGDVMEALAWFVAANVSFELACVFYNAFLPDVAPPEKIGRVSGYGWALGYAGGLAALVLALFLLVKPIPAPFGLDRETYEHVRATALLVAAWFAVFSVPMFLWVKEDRSRANAAGQPVLRSALRQLARTFHEVRRYRQVVRFLLARLLYNDGLITVFAFGGIYAAGTFGFTTEKLIFFGIVLNVTAALGAWSFGFLDDRLGGRRTIEITLLALFASTLVALLVRDETLFWIAGSLVGVFAGPNQSASRSLMGRFVPPDKENEFFGFFAFSGKATAFLGPFLFGLLTQAFDSQRAGMAGVLLFFALGWLILRDVDEAEGRRAALED
jgi:UMF1 family MFS transporter